MAKIGLVLSGGMAKGAYQVGALKAIRECLSEHEIEYISASSVGVLNAYAFASGKLDLIEEMWRDVCHEDNSRFITSVCRGSFLQRSLRKLASETDTLPPYLYLTLYNTRNYSLNYVNLADASPKSRLAYLKASIAMPIYSKAITAEGVPYLDGAMVDNIPVYPLEKHAVDYIICIYFDDCNYVFENEFLDSRVIKLVFSDSSVIKTSVYLDEHRINYMLKNGYSYTKEYLETLFSKGIDNKEYVYRKIKLYNKLHENKKSRVTGDALVSKCNRIAKRLIRKQIT